MLHLPEGSTKERGTPGTPGTFVLVCVFVYVYVWVSQVALALKNLPSDAGDGKRFNPGSEMSPGRGHGNLLQYSGLENPIDRGAWRAIPHGVAKSRAQLKQLSTHMSLSISVYLSVHVDKFIQTCTYKYTHTHEYLSIYVPIRYQEKFIFRR